MHPEVSQLSPLLASAPRDDGRAEVRRWGSSLWSVRIGDYSYGVARRPGAQSRARVVGGIRDATPALLLNRRVREHDDVRDILRAALVGAGSLAG